MYTEYLTTECKAPEKPQRFAPSRRVKRRRKSPVAALVLFLAGLICGCLADRAVVARGAAGDPDAEKPAAVCKAERRNIPTAIVLPDYIKEDLLPVNPYSRCGDKLERVNAVVIHYVGNPNTTAWQNRSYFANLADNGATSASSNLIVGLEGEVILCVPLDEVAYCSNDRNYDTVSVEFCHPEEDGKPTQATYDALVKLTAWLCDLYGLDAQTDVIRHYDVIGKECPRYFVQHEDAWEQFKADAARSMEMMPK